MNKEIKETLKDLPKLPGVYVFYDEKGTIIYIGKAKVLKERVKQYFQKPVLSIKTNILVSQIKKIGYTIVSTEVEALLLENTLIKKHQPKYNILLKDDKTYPYISITKEEYPRVILTRKKEKNTGEYFGPYPSEKAAKTLVEVANSLYPIVKLANCGRRNPCLYYHTKSCLAPCFYDVNKKEYNIMIKKIRLLLKGDQKETVDKLKKKMLVSSEKLDFETAGKIRDWLKGLEKAKEEQKVIFKQNYTIDVFNYEYENQLLSVYILLIRNGTFSGVYENVFEVVSEEKESVEEFLYRYYEKNNEKPKEVLLPGKVNKETNLEINLDVKFIIPQRGTKKKLLETAKKNANLKLLEYKTKTVKKKNNKKKTLEEISRILNIPYPKRIEMFDNSNIQGTNAVSGMVVFIDGEKEKKEYRKYKIKNVDGADDVGTMKEVIERRFKRLLSENKPLPDLLIVDGGKGQIKAASNVLKRLGIESVHLIGLVKNEQHKTSHIMDESMNMYELKKNREIYYLLTSIQDEAHRYAVSFYRETHKKNNLRSVLDQIPGVGEKRKKTLLKHFKTIAKMKEAELGEYKKIGIPEKIAERIKKEL